MHAESLPRVEWLGRISYERALALQDQTVMALAGKCGGEVLFLLEHDPVYTIGRTRDRTSLGNAASLSHPVIETNRGGQATYHGPGQLVGYPLLDLAKRGRDLHLYMRFLEEVLIKACSALGVCANRREGLTGVWVSDRKIASIGVGLRKWITMHGFALNVCGPLEAFDAITPCGISGVRITSMEVEAGRNIALRDAAGAVEAAFLHTLNKKMPVPIDAPQGAVQPQ